jgi:hypothetical protein
MPRLRALSEAECYLRCYGWVGGGDEAVRILDPHADEGDEGARVLAERMRRAYERRITRAEAEAA